MSTTRAHRAPASPRQTTWRHVWLAGLGTIGAGTRTAREAMHGTRSGLRDGLLQARDAAGTTVERIDAAQRRFERRLRDLRPGATRRT